MAVDLTVAQLCARMALPGYARAPTLGLIYITDHYAAHAKPILQRLASKLPSGIRWTGTTGMGVCATDTQYWDEPALSVMLCDLPHDQYRVYSGLAPFPRPDWFHTQMALVHADGGAPDLSDLLDDMAKITECGYLFGGLAASRTGDAPQFAWTEQVHNRWQGGPRSVFSGGLSGVAFGPGVTLASRVAQACQPIAPERLITAAADNLVLTLDGQPALDVLIRDLGLDLTRPHQALTVLRETLAGLANPGEDGVCRTGDFGPGVRVRRLIGVDAQRRAVAVGDTVSSGQRLAFCRRTAQAAHNSLVRICAEIREALEARTALINDGAETGDVRGAGGPRILGAHYVGCAAPGCAPGAELHTIRQVLGEVPLTGFFADGAIAYRYLYGHAGVLTVFAESTAGAAA
jgi:small ligand-binding sensory domain FIST